MDLKKRLYRAALGFLILPVWPLMAQTSLPEVPAQTAGSLGTAKAIIVAGSSLYLSDSGTRSAGIENGRPGFLRVQRTPKASIPPAEPYIPLNSGDGRRGIRLNGTWAWVGSAVALAVGAAGFYFKARADKSFDNYLDTIVPEQMDRYFNNTIKYDKISSICYGTGEVVLVFSLVVFINTVKSE